MSEENDLITFVENFDYSNPDWSNLPKNFPHNNLAGLNLKNIGKYRSILTCWELKNSDKHNSKSRTWSSSHGYRFLIQWSNAVLLKILVRKLTTTLPRSEYRMKAQIDDAARSAVANLEEGFKRSTTKEYIQFIGYSQGSLEEVKGDIERLFQDGFLGSRPGSSLADLGIDLGKWNDWCKVPDHSSIILQFSVNSVKGDYRILEDIKGSVLTYEIMRELINKTDFMIRKLVQSLEIKQGHAQKGL